MKQHRNDDGYVAAMTSLLMVPLMVFAAFAVDIGAWYVRGQQAQVAADAASLAGVALLPDFNEAKQVALDTAARNGYLDQPGCDGTAAACTPTSFPQVVVEQLASTVLEVTIFTEAEVYLGQVVLDDEIDVTRFAVAESLPPVPMGNPSSTLGGGSDEVADIVSNFWLRAMPECEPRSTGDLIGSGGNCSGNANPNHRPEGHTFVVDVPVAGSYDIQARITCAEFGGDQANAPMTFTLYDTDSTPFDDNDNVTGSPLAVNTIDRPDTAICPDDGSGWSRTLDPAPWVNIHTVGDAGRYVLQAKNPAFAAANRSLYSLRVVPSGLDLACSRVGPSGTAGCPTILAKDYLTTYTNAELFPGGTIGQAQLYLAEIDDRHAGNIMEVELFDPADGVDEVRIVAPDGSYADVPWYSIDCLQFGYDCGRGDLGSPAVPISQTCGGDPCIRQDTGISFQDRTIRIEIPLPTTYQCVYPAAEPRDCWWRVEYRDLDLDTNETMTWSVQVLGDPIRLVE